MKTVHPSVEEKAFNCPYCFALTTQYWYRVGAIEIRGKNELPFFLDAQILYRINEDREVSQERREMYEEILRRTLEGNLFLDDTSSTESTKPIWNLHLSKCFNCKKVAVWVCESLVFPSVKEGPLPNNDLPQDVAADFEEARGIVNASPRGAAALLRLCVQKLCRHLGEGGKNIDDDIANLVKKGLNPLVQKSLDIVRVIGNEAVHPGVIDLRDDRKTALHLFSLVNAVADQMISHPKAVTAMYAALPESKRKAIEARDKR